MPHPPLPPLPPVGDDSGSRRSDQAKPATPWALPRLAGRSIIDILVDEHHELVSLCAELSDRSNPADQRAQVADVLTATLVRHLSAEEQYLLPTVRRMLPDGEHLAEQEVAADQAMRHTLRRLQAALPTERGYERLVQTIAAQVARHTEEASRETFPRLRAVCTDEELARLGSRVMTVQVAAPQEASQPWPHPAAPTRPPWNKLVDPGMGVVDKIRDALLGRTTYLVDLRLHPDG